MPAYVQDAVRGEFREVAKLLIDNGGKVYEDRMVGGWLASVWGWAVCKGCTFVPRLDQGWGTRMRTVFQAP